MKKIIISICVLCVTIIAVCFIRTNLNIYNSLDDFFRDPFRIDNETEYGYISIGAIKITDDYKFVCENIVYLKKALKQWNIQRISK